MSEGVRGATINAISSSIPEMLTTLIALFILTDTDGFAVGIGTTAGSALFNGMIIPAVCILAVVGTVVLGKKVTSVDVSAKVILRDGLCLIAAELVLILLLNGTELHWWHGLILMAVYFAYVTYMLLSMKSVKGSTDGVEEELDEDDEPTGPIGKFFYWLSLGPTLDLEDHFVKERHRELIKAEKWNAWPLLLASTGVIAGACWLLVKACEWLGTGPSNLSHPTYSFLGFEGLSGLNMPALFVAVIFASMATSVPDTIISMRDAKDGDYDDAVANALGSNIFDICFALGFPLFLFTIINGSIEMSETIAEQSAQLRLLLLFFTIAGFFVYFVGKRKVQNGITTIPLGKPRAFVLLAIYAAFATYIIALGAQAGWAVSISDALGTMLEIIPGIG